LSSYTFYDLFLDVRQAPNRKMLQFAKIFIGDVVTVGSDQAILAAVVAHFEATSTPAVILANVNLGGRQLDCVAVTATRAVVLEAKGYHRRLRGGPNGAWEVEIAGGAWKAIQSPYLQVLGGRHALRDAMAVFDGGSIPYPDAAVVFAPTIPPNSQLSSDFKVAILGLDELPSELSQGGAQGRPLDKWKAFARHHRLNEVPDVATACSPVLAEAHALLARYASGFLRTYRPLTTGIVDALWENGEASVSSDQLMSHLTRGGDAYLLGPSGCGKSMTAYGAAAGFAEKGGVPIAVAAKNFSVSMNALLDEEVYQIVDADAGQLISAAARLDRPVMLLLDGLNECSDTQRGDVVRRAAAFARRYAAGITVTTQAVVERSDLLPLDTYVVVAPGPDMKLAIARQAAEGQALPASAIELLNVVGTGLEAGVVGRLGTKVDAEVSRFGLLDLYVRERLGDGAADGVARLAAIAGWMAERITFSTSRRDVERLADSSSRTLADQLVAAGVLVTRGERISFQHDLYMDAYAAEAAIRAVGNDAQGIANALGHPVHAKRKEFILGAIDDPVLLEEVFAVLADPELILSCLAGRCGRRARDWAEAGMLRALTMMAEEIDGVRLVIEGEKTWSVGFEPSVVAWTAGERAFIYALPSQVLSGHHLETMLALVARMDRRLASERVRLGEEASLKNIGLRGESFYAAYLSQMSGIPALSHVSSCIHAGLVPWHANEAIGPRLLELLRDPNVSMGQAYFLLSLFHRNGKYDTAAAMAMADLIDRFWKGAPYHFKLDLIDHAGWCWRAADAAREALIAKIEALPTEPHIFLSTSVVDALQHLGGLEAGERQHEKVVRNEIAQCLAAPEDQNMQAAAFGVYSACMDHPYSNAYAVVFNALPPEDRATMLTMAAHGAGDDSFFLSPLIVETASLSNKLATEALQRFLAPPRKDSFNPGDAIQAFTLAHLAYGQNGLALPRRRDDENDPAEAALSACGTILYWMNRIDQSVDDQMAGSSAARTYLHGSRGAAVLNCLRLTERVYIEGWRRTAGLPPVTQSIAAFVPQEALALAKQALADPSALKGYFEHYHQRDRYDDLGYAVGLVGRFGTTADIPLLRRLAALQELGGGAIAGIRSIEERSAL
jgi:hypothetical protein